MISALPSVAIGSRLPAEFVTHVTTARTKASEAATALVDTSNASFATATSAAEQARTAVELARTFRDVPDDALYGVFDAEQAIRGGLGHLYVGQNHRPDLKEFTRASAQFELGERAVGFLDRALSAG